VGLGCTPRNRAWVLGEARVRNRLEVPWGGAALLLDVQQQMNSFSGCRAPCCGQFALEGSRRISHPSGVFGKRAERQSPLPSVWRSLLASLRVDVGPLGTDGGVERERARVRRPRARRSRREHCSGHAMEAVPFALKEKRNGIDTESS
jgi:hypothetical protein